MSAADFIPSVVISAFNLPRFVITSRQLIFASVGLLSLSAVFALLNLQKTHSLRTEIVQSENARQTGNQQRISHEKQLKDREAAMAAANAKFGDIQRKVADNGAQPAESSTGKKG